MATPVFASNASLPTLTVTSNNPVLSGSVGNVVSVKISNPANNVYTITGFSIVGGSGWTFTGSGTCAYLPSNSNTASGSLYTVSTFTVGTGAGVPPGQNCVVTFTATAPTGSSYPINSAFTTSIQDASGVGYYPGPSFTVQVIDSTTTIAIAVTANGPNTAAVYYAGTAAYTVVATVSTTDSISEAGLTINFVDTGSGATAALASSFGSSSVTTVSATASTATATTTFQPSNTATKTGIPKATIGTCSAATPVCTITSGTTITTSPGVPVSTTVSVTSSSTNAAYLTVEGIPSFDVVNYAFLASGAAGITGTIWDNFGNQVTTSLSFAAGQNCLITGFGGSFGGGATPAATDTIVGGTATYCTAGGLIEADLGYYQSLNYGTSSNVQVSMTGTYTEGATPVTFTATGRSLNIITSSIDAAVPAAPSTPGLTTSPTQASVAGAGGISAGSSTGVASTISLTYQLTNAQSGVPITFQAKNTTTYLGSFVGGMGTSIHHGAIVDWANITVTTTISAGVATATATFTVDTKTGHSTGFLVILAHPITGTPGNKVVMAASYGPFVTKAGADSKLSVLTYFDSALTVATTKSIAGQNIYLNVILQDFWGNTALNTLSSQLNIQLTISPSTAGTFSAASVYIPAGGTNTAAGFGTIVLVLSSSVALGALTLSATGLYSGTSTLTIVSPNPTISVATPSGTSGHTIYSKFSGVGYSGTAAVSAGVYPAPTLANIYYTIDGGSTNTACTGAGCTSWSFVATLANGLHTIAAWSKDSAGSLSTSNSTTVLVDTSAPTITNPTTLQYGAGTAIVFTVVDSEGDLKSVSASVNGTALAASQVTITSGTNNPGSSVSYSVSVTGLSATTGHYGIVLSATDWAGNTATGTSVVVQVTVQQANSLVVQGTPTSGMVGNYEGVTATYQNVWFSSQNVVVFAVWKNGLGQTVYISAGSANLASGASQSFFLPEVGLSSGTYSVSLFVWTTSNTSVSVTTPVTVTF